MKTSLRVRKVSFLAMAVLLLLAIPAVVMAAEPTVNLRTSAGFAILAGQAITNTGPTTITGDVGLHPGTSFDDTGVTLNGSRHIADAVALQAKNDLELAYDDAAGRTPTGANIGVELGGQTLTPGVYRSGGVFELTGTLILDAQGDPDAVFIFQSTATLETMAGSRIELINGARFCRVFWVVPSSATLGTNSEFVGHIFALTDITAMSGAKVEGQLLARNGSVSLSANEIENEICAVVRSINITKQASRNSLPAAGGSVTYTYTVTSPGTVEFNDVYVTDDKIDTVSYVSGDVNMDEILQPGETWIYTATDDLVRTTTNIGTVTGTAGGVEMSDTDTETVTVPVAVDDSDETTTTVSVVEGYRLPDTATPLYNLLFAGIVLMMVGFAGWRASRIHA